MSSNATDTMLMMRRFYSPSAFYHGYNTSRLIGVTMLYCSIVKIFFSHFTLILFPTFNLTIISNGNHFIFYFCVKIIVHFTWKQDQLVFIFLCRHHFAYQNVLFSCSFLIYPKTTAASYFSPYILSPALVATNFHLWLLSNFISNCKWRKL